MAAVGVVVTVMWFPPSGLVGFFVLLFLTSIFLTALCADCNRRSFELEESLADKNPSTLIRVVKLEEVRENPMMEDILKDEEEFHQKEKTSTSVGPLKSQQGETRTFPDTLPEEDSAVSVTPWRSHLGAPPSQDSAHLYDTINGRQDSHSPLANHKPKQQPCDDSGDKKHFGLSVATITLSDHDRNSMYARISRKVHLTSSPAPTPEESPKGEESPQMEEGEESSPPLPHRSVAVDE